MTDPKKTKPRSGVYLPTLPKGFEYTVTITGPDTEVTIGHGPDDRTTERQVTFRTDGKTVRGVVVEDLNRAAKVAADGVRAMDKIRRDRIALLQAESDTLMSLGEVLSPEG